MLTFTPNSWGSLREAKKDASGRCHLPAGSPESTGGQFTSCGDAKATVDRELNAAFDTVFRGIELDAEDAHEYAQYGVGVRAEDAQATKKHVARAIGKRLLERVGFEPLAAFYQQFTSMVRNYAGRHSGAGQMTLEEYRAQPQTLANVMAGLLVAQWARSSSDESATSSALQLAAVEEFALQEAAVDHLKAMDADNYEELNRRTLDILDTHRTLLRGFLRVVYENTQEYLKTFPGDDVLLFRGMSVDAPMAEGGADIQMQPLSAFSVLPRTAVMFSGGVTTQRGAHAVLVAARVPKSQIYSTTRSGPGCLHEGEMIVLGGRTPGHVVPKSTVAGYSPDETVTAWLQRYVAHRGKR